MTFPATSKEEPFERKINKLKQEVFPSI